MRACRARNVRSVRKPMRGAAEIPIGVDARPPGALNRSVIARTRAAARETDRRPRIGPKQDERALQRRSLCRRQQNTMGLQEPRPVPDQCDSAALVRTSGAEARTLRTASSNSRRRSRSAVATTDGAAPQAWRTVQPTRSAHSAAPRVEPPRSPARPWQCRTTRCPDAETDRPAASPGGGPATPECKSTTARIHEAFRTCGPATLQFLRIQSGSAWCDFSPLANRTAAPSS